MLLYYHNATCSQLCCNMPSSETILFSPGLLTFINVMSVKLYVKLQNVFTVCKLVVCGVVVGSGIFMLATGELSKQVVENMIDT